MQKRTKNKKASGGITTKEYNPILTSIKFTNISSKQ